MKKIKGKIFLRKIKENLLSQKRDLISKFGQVIEIDADGDETDEIQSNLLMGILNQLTSRDNSRLNQINDALKRIESQTYGLCLDCEEIIPDKRLIANPYCLTCVDCAEDRENQEKNRRLRA